MAVVSRSFVNELGNRIYISARESVEDGEPRVKLSLAGPNSRTTQVITPLEFEALLSLMSKFDSVVKAKEKLHRQRGRL